MGYQATSRRCRAKSALPSNVLQNSSVFQTGLVAKFLPVLVPALLPRAL
jgi:hypothetical protein